MPLVATIHGTDVNGEVFTQGAVMKGSENQEIWVHIVNEDETQNTNVQLSGSYLLEPNFTSLLGIDAGADIWLTFTLNTTQDPGEQGGEYTINWDGAVTPITFTLNWSLLAQETIEVPVEVPGPAVVKREVSSAAPLRYNPHTGEIK